MIVRFLKNGKHVYLPSAATVLSNIGNRKFMRRLRRLIERTTVKRPKVRR